MLIDEERCTRCDECVRACVDTHDDGRSRLFLDGPRFEFPDGPDKKPYLVPTTCRSCRDPQCMISCPVGSIHRGNRDEMVIENWCIGCSQCSKYCPYGAIQMHEVGLIPEGSAGWQYHDAAGIQGEGWMCHPYPAKGWQRGRSPFVLDREFRGALGWPSGGSHPGAKSILFRREFLIPEGTPFAKREFTLRLSVPGPKVTVYFGGSSSPVPVRRGGNREPADLTVPPGYLRSGQMSWPCAWSLLTCCSTWVFSTRTGKRCPCLKRGGVSPVPWLKGRDGWRRRSRRRSGCRSSRSVGKPPSRRSSPHGARKHSGRLPAPQESSIHFRCPFALEAAAPTAGSLMHLRLSAPGPAIQLWVNGQQLDFPETCPEETAALTAQQIRTGANILAVQATPADTLFDLGLLESEQAPASRARGAVCPQNRDPGRRGLRPVQFLAGGSGVHQGLPARGDDPL